MTFGLLIMGAFGLLFAVIAYRGLMATINHLKSDESGDLLSHGVMTILFGGMALTVLSVVVREIVRF